MKHTLWKASTELYIIFFLKTLIETFFRFLKHSEEIIPELWLMSDAHTHDASQMVEITIQIAGQLLSIVITLLHTSKYCINIHTCIAH